MIEEEVVVSPLSPPERFLFSVARFSFRGREERESRLFSSRSREEGNGTKRVIQRTLSPLSSLSLSLRIKFCVRAIATAFIIYGRREGKLSLSLSPRLTLSSKLENLKKTWQPPPLSSHSFPNFEPLSFPLQNASSFAKAPQRMHYSERERERERERWRDVSFVSKVSRGGDNFIAKMSTTLQI